MMRSQFGSGLQGFIERGGVALGSPPPPLVKVEFCDLSV